MRASTAALIEDEPLDDAGLDELLDAVRGLARNVVLEIEDVGEDRDIAFLMGTVLVRLVEHLRPRLPRGGARRGDDGWNQRLGAATAMLNNTSGLLSFYLSADRPASSAEDAAQSAGS